MKVRLVACLSAALSVLFVMFASCSHDTDTALSSCITSSWRDGYRTEGDEGLYYYDDGTSVYGKAPFDNNWFGLTIGGDGTQRDTSSIFTRNNSYAYGGARRVLLPRNAGACEA